MPTTFFGRLAVSLFMIFVSSHAWAAPNDCDGILIKQIDWSKSNERYQRSWLQLVNDKNYSEAKKTASGSYYSGMFKGNYESFKREFNSRFRLTDLYENDDVARENYKSYFSPEQLTDWSKCKNLSMQLSITYKDISNDAVTIVLSWNAPPEVGNIRNVVGNLHGVKNDNAIRNIEPFIGDISFILDRIVAGSAIRGIVNGVAGANSKRFSESIYVAPILPIVGPPKRQWVNQAGQVQSSIVKWGRKHPVYRTFPCLKASDEFDFVRISTRQKKLGSSTRGQCAPYTLDGRRTGYCDGGAGEYCSDIIVTKGCLVSVEWHKWYKDFANKNGIPYSKETVCEPPAALESTPSL